MTRDGQTQQPRYLTRNVLSQNPNQPTNQPTSQTTNQPTNNQSTIEPTNKLSKWLIMYGVIVHPDLYHRSQTARAQ